MDFLKALWVLAKLRIWPLPPELQEMADTARKLDLRVSRKMSTEEFLAFVQSRSRPSDPAMKPGTGTASASVTDAGRSGPGSDA